VTALSNPRHHQFLSSIEEVVEDARNGRMFILVDAEERENEGDLVIPAQMATPDAINFMAKHGRGLICLALTPERAKQLHLELMSRSNRSRHSTAFTCRSRRAKGSRPASPRMTAPIPSPSPSIRPRTIATS